MRVTKLVSAVKLVCIIEEQTCQCPLPNAKIRKNQRLREDTIANQK